MQKKLFVLFILLFLLSFGCNDPSQQVESQCFTEYVAGAELLHHISHGMHPDTVSSHLKKLEKCTGVSEEEAISYLKSLKNDPEKGNRFSKSLQQLYTEPTVTLQKNKEKL